MNSRVFPLTSGIPAPPERDPPAFRVGDLKLADMTVGQSFLIGAERLRKSPTGAYVTAQEGRRVHMAARRVGIKVRVAKRMAGRDGEEGIRVWRIA